MRYKHNDEIFKPSFESNFQLTKKTADGEVIVPTDDGVYEVTKSMIDDANESEDVNLQVHFSFVFTYSESDTTTPSLFIGYPVGEGVTNKITFQGTGQNAGIITVNRLNIFDADRDAGSCAEFTEADQNQFVGSSSSPSSLSGDIINASSSIDVVGLSDAVIASGISISLISSPVPCIITRYN